MLWGLKAWKIGAIIGISFIILEMFYRGWASNHIRDFYFASFGFRQIIATAAAVLFAIPFGMILSFLDLFLPLSQYLPQRLVGVFASSIGALFFYLPLLITPAFIGYLVDIRNSDTPLGKGLSRLKSRENLKKGFLYFAFLITLFFLILYIPEPELVTPKEGTNTISATPVFQSKFEPIIHYPYTFVHGPSANYANSDDRISAVGGGGLYGFDSDGFESMVYPLQDGRKIDATSTKRIKFMKYVDFEFQRYHYYFTVNASQHPSPEEMEVIDYLIDKNSIIAEKAVGFPYLNPPSEKELETIAYLKEEGIPPFGTRLKDIDFSDIKSSREEK